MNKAKQRPVLIVGAGPVGMTAALAIRSLGIQTAIIEAEQEGRFRPGSRAIYIHKATLKLLEEVAPGLGFTLSRHGIIWPVKRTLYRGKEVYARHYPAPLPGEIPAFTSLAQVDIERYMYDACLKAGVEFIWNTPITDVKTSDDGVTLTASNGDVWTAEYVIAADGGEDRALINIISDLYGLFILLK